MRALSKASVLAICLWLVAGCGDDEGASSGVVTDISGSDGSAADNGGLTDTGGPDTSAPLDTAMPDSGNVEDTATPTDTAEPDIVAPEDAPAPDMTPPEDIAVPDIVPVDEGPDPDVGPTDVSVPDVAPDVAPDIPPDIAEPDITEPDVPPPLDIGTTVCEPACFLPEDGEPDAGVNLIDESAPSLAGGPTPTGWYQLESADLYIADTFTGLVTSVSVSSNGMTYGSLEFIGDEWGLAANLDLNIQLQAIIGDPINTDFQQPMAGGGCFAIDGTFIEGDFLQCGGSWVEGVEAPTSFEYETAGDTVKIKIVLTVAMITSILPPEYQDLAGLALAGDLPVVLNFFKP